MKVISFFYLAVCLFLFNRLASQTVYQLPPNQPEQDACNALQLCGGNFNTPYSYTGIGKKLDLDETPCFQQPGGGEKNSVWLKIHILSAGTIDFKIKPVSPEDDYDFAVLNITDKDCSALTSDNVVRCNYNNNIQGSNVEGIIGLNDTALSVNVQEGAFGSSYCRSVNAKSDEVYLIMINNFGNYVGGGPSKGFSIDFTGSTSTFYDAISPQLINVDVPCNNANSIVVKTNVPISCSSIAADGSDFETNAPANIISASGINCTDRGGYTNSILINFSSVLPDGSYKIKAKKGNDNNTLTGLCDNELLLLNNTSFIVKRNNKVVIDNEFICYQQLPYLWHNKIINGNDSGKIYVSTSVAGCDSTTILNLKVSKAPQQVNMVKKICDGDFYTLPWDSTVTKAGTYTHHFTNINGCDSVVENITINVTIPTGGNAETRDSTIQTGFCENGSTLLRPANDFTSYLWNTGETTNSIIVKVAGAYSLIAKDNFGCTSIDTFVVAAYQYPTPKFNSVENLCNGGTKVLDAGITSSYYLWNDGSSKETITTNNPGLFWVTLTNSYSCTVTDTVKVVVVQKPSNFLIPDVTKCSFKPVSLSPLNNFNAYTWNNGSDTKSIDITTGGLYWLDATDNNGCIGRDSINVIDSICPEYFFMPTAFTPNNDYQNDIFKPTFAGSISGYHFLIYNRWGKLIFSTKNPLNGWDGMVKGYQQPIGTYIWVCSYSLEGLIFMKKGTVTLIR